MPSRDLADLRTRTIWRTLVDTRDRFPDRDALVAADDAGHVQRLTYTTLADRVAAVSGGFAEMGVRGGDRLVLWMTNIPEWVICSFAAMRLGAAVVPVNTFLTAPEVEYFVTQSGARHIVLVDAFRSLRPPELLDEITGPDLRNVVVFSRGGGQRTGALDLAELEQLGREHDAAARAEAAAGTVAGDDLAMVKYTSGSTGLPKGVMLEQGGIVANAVMHSRRIGVDSSDVWFSMMPFFHAGGSIWGLMTMIVNGGTLVFTEAFDASLGARLVEQERATVQFGVLAEELARAADTEGRDLSSLRIAHVPGAAFTVRPFGLTEAYGPAAVLGPDDPPTKGDTVGRMLDGNECRVVDPATGQDVGPGEVGEAWIRGNVMRGYWNKPDETARVLDPDGWLHSEDLVTMDAEGYIRYVGRLKLMVKVGGENVSLEEVEGAVAGYDAVAACGAVGVPDRRKGEGLRAYVELRAGHTVDTGELRAWLGARLARFKLPGEIVVVDALPRLENGKLDRMELARRAAAEVSP